MSQPAAETFPCANCGAKLAYDAASQTMACEFCGTKQAVPQPQVPVQLQGIAGTGALPAAVEETTIEEGMRMAARGYGAPVTTIGCKDCGATVHVGEGERTTACAFCGSKQVLPEGAGEPPIRPGGLLPFRVPKEDANKRFGAWIGALWFRPNDLKKIARVEEMGGVYVPFWTFNADVASQWTADRGHYYYETESYTETINGRREERTRQVQHTRWEGASGWRNDHFDDMLVPAGRALPENLVGKLSTFDTKQLVPYQPHFLAGWRAEQYAVDLPVAFNTAQQKMARVQEGRCGGDVGGDTHRNLSVSNEIQRPTFKHVLMPVWIAAYRYNGKVYRFLVNGQTGEVVGVAPWSFLKIAAFVVVILAIIGGIVAAVARSNASSSSITPITPSSTATATATPTATPAAPPTPTPHATPHSGATPHPPTPAPSASQHHPQTH
jgi:DNA-directed RNA polymerase subunit RPC12/RpoP